MTRTYRRRGTLLTAVGALAIPLAACSSEEPDGGAAPASTSSSAAPVDSSAAPVSTEPFGPACSAVPAEGEGSFAGMADDPVATAASHNPVLTSLAQAVTAAGLGPSLDSQPEVTVLAPANPAFEAIPAGDLQALLADTARLTSVLTHHVISGRLAPDQLAGTHTTLNNDEITVAGEGETFTVAGDATVTRTPATVICGNVQTANATVYLIDQVLAPTS